MNLDMPRVWAHVNSLLYHHKSAQHTYRPDVREALLLVECISVPVGAPDGTLRAAREDAARA
jgi:hypothetical protein